MDGSHFTNNRRQDMYVNKSLDRRPINSRQISTSKTTRTYNDLPGTTNCRLKHDEQELWKNCVYPDRRNLETPEVRLFVATKSDEMTKKNLTISQMCNFYRAAGLSTVEQNMRQQQGRSGQNIALCASKSNRDALQLNPRRNLKQQAVHTTRNPPLSNGSSSDGRDWNGNCKKENTMFFRDEALKRIKEASSVYLDDNRTFHERRMKRLETSINNQQRRKFERQLTETRKEFTDKLKRNVTNLAELKKVRKRYWKEKQHRVNNTYVSVAALEMPEVDRYAYGLPAEGKEHSYINHRSSLEVKEKLMRKWESSKKKASAIVKMLDMTKKLQKCKTLPMLKPLTSYGNKSSKLNMNESIEDESGEENTATKIMEEINATKALVEISSEISSIQENSESESDYDDM